MNDPWHVKSVKLSDQYVSCMKINGTPLLPPVLSKECRKEMQYYKLLAKEVEKRISILRPYVDDSDSENKEQDTDKNHEKRLLRELKSSYNSDDQQVSIINAHERSIDVTEYVPSEPHSNIKSSVVVSATEGSDTTKFVIDLSLTINESNNILEAAKNLPQYKPAIPVELPERDYNDDSKSPEKELTFKTAGDQNNEQFSDAMEQTSFFAMDVKDKKDVSIASPSFQNNFHKYPFYDGLSSLTCKSFTGSLIDIHYETSKEAVSNQKLIRQRSYTVLEPSPQLLAHLELQSMKTGVNVKAISMSESTSKLNSTGKKRKGWDLESAKEKWSSMANELNRNRLPLKFTTKSPAADNKTHVAGNVHVSRQVAKKSPPSTQTPPARAHSVAKELTSRNIPSSKISPKSYPLPAQTVKNQTNSSRSVAASKTFVIESDPKTSLEIKKTSTALRPRSPDTSDSEDPAAKVKKLYEKIQKQQLLQMANLVEKQKREQILLQKVFEEQNTLLFKQLKTICPKSPVEIKTAWGDKSENKGPVSLRQVINHKPNSTAKHVSSALHETSNFINRCEDVLKKSKDLTSKIDKRTPRNSKSLNGNSGKSAAENTPPLSSPRLEGSRTRTHSPTNRNTARKLNYDASLSIDCEPALTDRTNDTLADLNVTFTTDEDDFSGKHRHSKTPPRTPTRLSPQGKIPLFQSADSTLKRSQRTHSLNTCRNKQSIFGFPSPKQVAAASTIVAYAKGYLVRRLMQTERVQATVQTIRDALLCALELHQDREGIRGADVDLHRRLIQQITAACYSLHDTFVASSPAERCALIAADRTRRRSLAQRQSITGTLAPASRSDAMSQSHSGAFPARARAKRPSGPSGPSPSLMTQSSYETFSSGVRGSRRRPWR